jgi:pimeloyl-ACP methyl ester carboxylesterase
MRSAPRLHVDSDGAGDAVIVGHGFGGSARNFGSLARALAATHRALAPAYRAPAPAHRVLRFDARGHARSEAPADADAYTPETFVADVGRVLDDAEVAAAVVGGLSMGAGIALRFALAHPERTRGLVLAAFPAGADTPGSYASVAEPFAACIEAEGLEAAGARYVWGPSSGLDPQGAASVRQGFLEHDPRALAHTLRGVIAAQPSAAALAPALANLRVPTLVVVGARDRTSLAPSRAVAAAIPGARLVEIADAGHLVNLARPAEFNRAVADFLTRLSGAVPSDSA